MNYVIVEGWMHVYYKGEMQYCTWVAIIISSDPLSAFEKAHYRVL